MQNSKLKMQNYNLKFKHELGDRIYQFVLELIKFLDDVPNDGTSQTIKSQLVRSGASIGANYIEAQAASSKKDFINFFNHSLKSANESRFWLILLRDSDRVVGESVEALLKELSELANILASSILTMKGRR